MGTLVITTRVVRDNSLKKFVVDTVISLTRFDIIIGFMRGENFSAWKSTSTVFDIDAFDVIFKSFTGFTFDNFFILADIDTVVLVILTPVLSSGKGMASFITSKSTNVFVFLWTFRSCC